MFIVLSSWQGHCVSLLCSFRRMQTKFQAATNPQTEPADLGCEFACRLLPSTVTIYYYYSALRLILILASHRG